MLHVSVEKSNNQLAKALIYSEFNVNVKEGCGLTSLHLALITGNETMALFLLERNSKYDGPLFSAVPSPKAIAMRLNLTDIMEAMVQKDSESDEENDVIANIDTVFKYQPMDEAKRNSSFASSTTTAGNGNTNCSNSGYVAHLIGDVGTCKTNQAVMSCTCAYNWVGICVGDMHNKGYFMKHALSNIDSQVYTSLISMY